MGSNGGSLSSVVIQDAYINPFTSGYDFGIYSANGDGTIGSEVVGFDSTPTHTGSGFLTLDAESSYIFSANTTYWLVGKMASNTFWWKYDNAAPLGTGSVPATKYRARSSNGGASWSYDTDVSSTAYGTGAWYYDFKLVIDTDVDVTSPSLNSIFPADGATNVTTTSNLILTFSESVDVESGNITIYKSSDNSIVEVIDVTSGQVTGSGTVSITINPSVTLDEQTAYYVQIDASAFDDTSSNSFAGIADATTWNFTTGDFTNPTISSLSPSDGSSGVSINSNLVITFTETVDAESGSIILFKSSDNSQIEVFDVTTDILGSGSTQITINPELDLAYETAYYVQIDASAFDDTFSNSFAGITDATTWNFTTEDTPSCPVIAHASSYNTYPTCGVVTCNDGYRVSDGACVPIGGGGAVAAPAVGVGSRATNIAGISQAISGVFVDNSGVNMLMHIWSRVNFNLSLSNNELQSHSLYVDDLDIETKTITVTFSSNPITVELQLGETKIIDLDQDGISDVKATFSNLVVNRIELTVTALDMTNKDESIGKEFEQILQEKVVGQYDLNNSTIEILAPELSRDLYLGIVGDDVKALQKYLNAKGFLVSRTGYGSLGNESTYFGSKTQQAVIAFQKFNNIQPTYGYVGPITRTYIK